MISKAHVIVNVAYSYAIVAKAAKEVQEQDHWINNSIVQKLKFSPHWIRGFLNRASFRRRKITQADKPIPVDEEVRATMKIGQDLYKNKGHSRKSSWNMDETAVTWSIGPLYLFCPIN